MTAEELFANGNLAGALAALTQEVKAAPNDPGRRTFLFELLCFTGDLDRAGRQLDVLAHQDLSAEPAVQVYRNLLHAERRRRSLFADGLAPEFLLDPPDWIRHQLDAANRLREGQAGEAQRALDASAQERPVLRGHLGDIPFEEFRDCDDLLAPVLELFIIRDYVWLPLAQIQEIEVLAPEHARDLAWAPVRLVLAGGAQHRGYAPVLYPSSHTHADDQVKLGQQTDWVEQAGGPTRGRGQHTFLIGDEARGLLELRRVSFDVA